MTDTSNSTELALQICFGIFGILGTIATLASLHHQDSLGCVLIRRLIHGRPIHHDDDLEATVDAYEDMNGTDDVAVPFQRRTTLPPAYEQSEPSLAPDLDGLSDVDAYSKVSETHVSNGREASGHVSPSKDVHDESTLS